MQEQVSRRRLNRGAGQCLLFLAIRRINHFINTGDKDSSIWCNQLLQEGDEVSHRFMHGPTKDARVEVTSWTADFDKHVYQTTEAVGDAWSASVEPVVIGLKDCIVKIMGLLGLGCPELTMQTASTPWNQPSFPLAYSSAINSLRPRLPLSSIPSKTRRRFTGSSIFNFR